MPTHKDSLGNSKEICYCTKSAFKQELQNAILNAYLSEQKEVAFNEAFNKPTIKCDFDFIGDDKNKPEAICKVYFDDCFCLSNVKVVKENGKVLVTFPYRKKKNQIIIRYMDFLSNRKDYVDIITEAFEKRQKAKKKPKIKIANPGIESIYIEGRRVYPGQNDPKTFISTVYRRTSLETPLDRVVVYDGGDYWHFVTFGLSDIFVKTIPDPENSGFGMEFTFKLKKYDYPDVEAELKQVDKLLQAIASVTFKENEVFLPYEVVDMGNSDPIDSEGKSNIVSFITIPDTNFNTIYTQYGRVRFVEFIGITKSEADYLIAANKGKQGVLDFYNELESDVTDYDREPLY
jgi:DNA-binding cell septation regulator SpoVG